MAAHSATYGQLHSKIRCFAFLSRLTLILLQTVFNTIIPDHDAHVFNPPSEERDKHSIIQSLFDVIFAGFKRWDGIYFTFVTQYGYTYENTLAFFPLGPLLVRTLANSILFPFQLVLCYDQVILLSWLILNLYLFVQSATMLFHLGQLITKNDTIAYKGALLFCITPASIFMTAPYSETIFTYLCLQGMIKLETGRKFQASFFFGLGCATRSNGLLNLGFLVYKISQELNTNFRSIKKGMFLSLTTFLASLWLFVAFSVIPSCVYIVLSLVPFVIYQYYCYAQYCKSEYSVTIPVHVEVFGRAEELKIFGDPPSSWCQDDIPLAYSYIQNHYWEQGFLRYWELKNIPNFLLAVPVTVLVYYTAKTFFKNNRYLCLTLGFVDDSYIKKKEYKERVLYQLEGVSALPYIVHAVAFTVFGWFCIHIQVLTRLLFSSNPVLYWSAAHLITKNTPLQQKSNKYDINHSKTAPVERVENLNQSWTNLLTNQIALYKTQDRTTKLVICYFISYFVIGTLLFSNFLPWT